MSTLQNGGGKRQDECLFTHRVGGNEIKVVYLHTKSCLNNGKMIVSQQKKCFLTDNKYFSCRMRQNVKR